MCHVGAFLIGLALWLESPLIMSWQAVSLLMADLIWTIDFVCALTINVHPFGATYYMFKPEMPQVQRFLALYHAAFPVILIWGIKRLGYDRRGLWAQIATCFVLFPLSYLLAKPEENINWVYGPFEKQQQLVSPIAFLFISMVLYPMVVYVPSHLVMMLLVRRPVRAVAIKAT